MPANKTLPHMGERKAQSLVEASQQKSRQKSSVSPFDGDGKYIEDITMDGGSVNVVRHHLGRVPRGYIVCNAVRNTGVANGWISSWDRDKHTITIHNNCAGQFTFSLWIF